MAFVPVFEDYNEQFLAINFNFIKLLSHFPNCFTDPYDATETLFQAASKVDYRGFDSIDLLLLTFAFA